MSPTLTITEDDRYYFDEEAADRVCRFIAKYVRHYEGEFDGKPFELLPWQRDHVVRPLFGWKRKRDGKRRFRELYCLTAKGSGKTPLLAAIGLYMLIGEKEAAAHVISCATDFQQANLTLDAGKKYVAAHPSLARICDPKQFEIRAPKNSKWTVMSGTAEGRHGFRPSCLLMDEAHEWPNGLLYQNLTANMPKRRQPLALVTTNAGPDTSCFAWTLHARALKVLKGEPGAAESLLPVIYEAPIELEWDSEPAAQAANPSLGTIVTFDGLSSELEKARESDILHGRYTRLYLSRWGGATAEKWLDVLAFDQLVESVDVPPKSPCFIGVDLALSDDLCSVVPTWPLAPDRFYVASRSWVPRIKAEHYERKHGVPYGAWETAGDITLVDEPTISSAVQRSIAAYIIDLSKRFDVKAVCYDKHRATECVAALEAVGITCVPTEQAWGVSEGSFELERRILEKSIRFAPNAVMRFAVENVNVKRNDRGQMWPIKPGANYATNNTGLRWKKIDPVAALVTALQHARRHTFPAAAKAARLAFA